MEVTSNGNLPDDPCGGTDSTRLPGTHPQGQFAAVADGEHAFGRMPVCRFLFDMPPGLIGRPSSQAAALVCQDAAGLSLRFMLWHDADREIEIIRPDEVPASVSELAYSLARVMSLLPEEKLVEEHLAVQ